MKFSFENFTYGIELEGMFVKKILKKLEAMGVGYRLKSDGSVRYENLYSNRPILEDVTNSSETEINIGIFHDFNILLKTLVLFENEETYFMDDHCGLHLHIKPKVDEGTMKGLFWDLGLIEKLEEFAFTSLCSCIKKRENNHFCEKYKDFKSFFRDIKVSQKYRFVRNHPSGTMEFRFFCPCKHKADNIKKFLEYMFTLLEAQEPKKSTDIELIDWAYTEKIDLSFHVENKDANTKFFHKLGLRKKKKEIDWNKFRYRQETQACASNNTFDMLQRMVDNRVSPPIEPRFDLSIEEDSF